MADDPTYIVPYQTAPQLHPALSGYLQGISHYAPPLAPGSLPVKIAAATAVAARVAEERDQEKEEETTWIEFELVGEDGKTVEVAYQYVIELPDGTTKEGKLDKGKVKLSDLKLNTSCKITFPDLDRDFWKLI